MIAESTRRLRRRSVRIPRPRPDRTQGFAAARPRPADLARARWRAGSRRCIRAGYRAGRAGGGNRAAAAALAARQETGGASGAHFGRAGHRQERGLRPRFLSRSQPSLTLACAIFARHTTPTAPSIRSSSGWSGPPGFAPHDDTRTKLDKFDALMGQTSAPTEDRAIFADLLSLSGADRYAKLDLSPALRRKRTIDAMMRRLEAMAQRTSRCWRSLKMCTGSTRRSLDVLSRMIDRIRDLPVLLLVTFRPEFAPPWVGQPQVTALALNRLAPRATADLVQRIIGNKALPGDIIGEIVARTDGVPLFIEELTNAAIETWTVIRLANWLPPFHPLHKRFRPHSTPR